MSPEVQNGGICGPIKSTDVLHIFFDKKRKKSLDVSGCVLVLTKISSGTSKKFESFSNFTTMNCCNYILYQSEQSSVLFSGIFTTINCCNYILYQSEQSSVLFSGIFTTINCCNYILYQSEQSSVLFSGIFTTINCCNYILYQSEQSSVLFSGIFTTINCCNYILYQSEQSSVFVFRDFKEYVNMIKMQTTLGFTTNWHADISLVFYGQVENPIFRNSE